jgi:hypothetical protein
MIIVFMIMSAAAHLAIGNPPKVLRDVVSAAFGMRHRV